MSTIKTPLLKALARRIAQREGLILHLLKNDRFLQRMAGDDRLYEFLIKSKPFQKRLPKDKWLIAHFLKQQEVIDAVAADPAVFQPVQESAGLQPLPATGEGESAATGTPLGWISSDRNDLETVKDQLLAFLQQENALSIDDFLRFFGLAEVLAFLRRKEGLQISDLLQLFPPDEIFAALGADAAYAYLRHDLESLSGRLEKDTDFLDAFIERREVHLKICQNRSFRTRVRYFQQEQTIAGLPYPVPGVVVSYPRAGSNFLQAILTQSSGLNNQSIYARKEPIGPRDFILSLKSHAPTPEYLWEEYRRKVAMPERPERIILLTRDPRDLMISFYEYTQTQRKTGIPQEDFLHGTCYFYASTIDPDSERALERAPLSVAAAYQKHIRAWFTGRPDNLDCIEVRYEDLVQQPEDTFARIFAYLNLDCPLATAFLPVKVSLYDSSRKERGVPGGWRHQQERYRVLLDTVHDSFQDEISLLGYDD
mgnify:CR=1 FL=1